MFKRIVQFFSLFILLFFVEIQKSTAQCSEAAVIQQIKSDRASMRSELNSELNLDIKNLEKLVVRLNYFAQRNNVHVVSQTLLKSLGKTCQESLNVELVSTSKFLEKIKEEDLSRQ